MDEQKSIGQTLDEMYREALEEVSATSAMSEEGKAALDRAAALQKQLINERESEQSVKKDRQERRRGIVKIVLDGAAIVVPVAVSSYWMFVGYSFEKEGCVPMSRVGRWITEHSRLFKT